MSNYLNEAKHELFNPEGENWNNAYLGLISSQKALYVDGYKRAADILAAYVDEQGHSQDFLVYPIIFLYRHSLELRLKEIIEKGRQLLDEEGKYPYHHKIDNLWKLVKEIAINIWPDGNIEELQQTENHILVLAEIDPDSFAFRYPINKEGDRALPALGNVNIKNFSEKIQEVLNILDGMDMAVTDYLDIKMQMEAEYKYDYY